jgi:hypothetical protein
MQPNSQRLSLALTMAGVLVALSGLTIPGPLRAQPQTCDPVASPSADVELPDNGHGAFDTGAHVIATFNVARQREGCTVSLSIDATAYDAATPPQQALMLVNAERRDRGLPLLQLDTTVLSQIAHNHSQESAQYGYAGHPSPVNQPGGKNDTWDRLVSNPAVQGHASCYAENVYQAWSEGGADPGFGSAADFIFWSMYQDSGSAWGHRHADLGYFCGNPPTFGRFSWVGFGGASATDGSISRFYWTADFLDDAGAAPYAPPATADTTPPTMSAPTIVDGTTVQVTDVRDDSNGAQPGAVTSVVFYVGAAVDRVNNQDIFRTVAATQDPANPGTWRASLAATDPATLHAVAVDGSGNYRDCGGGPASACPHLPTDTPVTQAPPEGCAFTNPPTCSTDAAISPPAAGVVEGPLAPVPVIDSTVLLGVTLCADIDYSGRCETFTADTPNLAQMGFNDAASSIRVPAGMAVSVYSDTDFGGRCETFTADTPDLRNTSWIGNDAISSLRLGADCPPGQGIPLAAE